MKGNKKIKGLKITALVATLLVPISYSAGKFAIKGSSDANIVLVEDNEYDGAKIKSIETTIPVESTTTTTTIQTTTTAQTTTTTTTTETTTTTTEPVDEYKDIRFLEELDNNDLSIDELDDFIEKYSSYSHYSYEQSLDIIKNNLESINNDYESIKGGIMCTLFESASENNVLSGYCSYDKIEQRDMTLQEQEEIMLEMCDNLSLSTNEKLVALAIFRHETGNGTSSRCVNDNNYGGIRLGSGEYAIYQTPEYGIYRTLMCINNHMKRSLANGNTSLEAFVYGVATGYNGPYADVWTSKILEFVGYVSSDYNNFENGNVYQMN